MSKKKQNKQKKQNQKNQQATQTKVQHFETRKEFITWLIGVFIWYAMSIGIIVWAIGEKKNGDSYLYETGLVTGVIFILAATGIIIGTVAIELGTILLGLMLVLMCLVLPIVSGYYPIIAFTSLFWISGVLMIIDSIAKLTKTTDKKYYKVILDFVGKLFNGVYRYMTSQKRSKAQEVMGNAADVVSKVFKVLTKIYGMIVVLFLLGVGIFCFCKGGITEGICMLLCALFFFICFK